MNEFKNNRSFILSETACDYAQEMSKITDDHLHVIWCVNSKKYYVCTDGLIRNFEKLIAIFENGKPLD